MAAYRTQVETGTTTAVKVPTVTKQPTISNAEVDRMMKKFAEPAMSGLVTVRAPSGQSVSFSPQKSLWKFLGVQRVDGKLVETYDKKALTELYGDTFDGVLITRGTGAKTGVTVEDVIAACVPRSSARPRPNAPRRSRPTRADPPSVPRDMTSVMRHRGQPTLPPPFSPGDDCCHDDDRTEDSTADGTRPPPRPSPSTR